MIKLCHHKHTMEWTAVFACTVRWLCVLYTLYLFSSTIHVTHWGHTLSFNTYTSHTMTWIIWVHHFPYSTFVHPCLCPHALSLPLWSWAVWATCPQAAQLEEESEDYRECFVDLSFFSVSPKPPSCPLHLAALSTRVWVWPHLVSKMQMLRLSVVWFKMNDWRMLIIRAND